MIHDIEIDAGARGRLSRGEIIIETEDVPGSPFPRLRLLAVLDAPPARVWSIIDRVGDYQNTMPNIKRSKEISREGSKVRAQVTVSLPFPLPDLTSLTEGVHTEDPGRRYCREWEFVEGDYVANTGAWVLELFGDDPGQTLIEYRLHAVPRIRIPRSIQRLTQKKALPRLVEHLRAMVAR